MRPIFLEEFFNDTSILTISGPNVKLQLKKKQLWTENLFRLLMFHLCSKKEKIFDKTFRRLQQNECSWNFRVSPARLVKAIHT